MNLFGKCLKIFQTKFIPLCLLVMLIMVLSLLVLFWISPLRMPPATDIQVQRNRYVPRCQTYQCVNEWIQTHQSKVNISRIHQICPGWVSRGVNKSFQLYQEEKVDWQFMHEFHYGYWYHYCHRKCGIDGPVRYFISSHYYNLQRANAWLQHELCIVPFTTIDSCRWRAYWNIFLVYFSYFSIPLTIILNYINLTTLLRLLGKGAGPALYLHMAEIVTDAILNIIVGLNYSLGVFSKFDYWLQTCGYYRYCSAYQSMGVMRRFVSFVNQAYLMAILADRLYCLHKPFHYEAMTDKQKKNRAKNITLKILLGSFTLYLPYLLFYTFMPVFLYWVKISDFWKVNFKPIVLSLSTFYVIITFALLICQIICGVLVEKKFRKFIKNKLEMKQESEVELKKRARDKQLLLGGTIGLNIITGLISAAFNMVRNQAFYGLLGYSKNYPWWSTLFYMADPVLTFANCNGGLVIHIFTVKSYRKAFKATRFGRLICRHQQVNPSQQNQ